MEMACVNCFSSVDVGTHICPCCGFDLGSEAPDPCALMGGTLLKERYVTGRVIGTGGFGITYLSYDTECEKVVAVKEYYSPATKLTYLKGKPVQSVKIGGEMIPVDITELQMTERQLTNAQIQNLRHLKRLEKLNLDNNFITDLSCISGLTELREVSFNNNNVHDIEFARGMKQLRHISGENSGVADISPLEGKSELVSVFFGDAFVTDISPLERLHQAGDGWIQRGKAA